MIKNLVPFIKKQNRKTDGIKEDPNNTIWNVTSQILSNNDTKFYVMD